MSQASGSRPQSIRYPQSVPLQTRQSINFVVVGGGISGLCAAIALKRVGHHVLVLESETDIHQPPESSGGVRMPPNMTKIFNHWGLSDFIESVGALSERVLMSKLEDGYVLGTHQWDVEMLEEAGGEFIFVHHSTLRQTLYEIAIEYGAEIRLSTEVLSIDPDNRTVTLISDGKRQNISADVIIGADGAHGICRLQVRGLLDKGQPTGLMMFSSIIPGSAMHDDDELRSFVEAERATQWVWFGDGHCALLFKANDNDDCALFFYAPDDRAKDVWDDVVSVEEFARYTARSESRLQKLAKLAAPRRIKVVERVNLDDWVHDSGSMLLIGDAAHPFPPGSIQALAMSVEDASVLAKLFSHLRSYDQIPSFLYAFQDLRQARVEKIRNLDMANIYFMTMPPSDMTEARDKAMRAKYDAGQNVLGGDDEDPDGNSEQWDENREIFGYDAEDEADNWWVEWGLLAERAKEGKVEMDVELNIQVESSLQDQISFFSRDIVVIA